MVPLGLLLKNTMADNWQAEDSSSPSRTPRASPLPSSTSASGHMTTSFSSRPRQRVNTSTSQLYNIPVANHSLGLGPNLTPNILVDFMNAKGNVLVTLSSGVATPNSLVSLLSELDIQLPADRTGLVVDHFNYDASTAAETHDVLLLPPPGPVRPDVKNFFGAGAGKDEVLAFPRGVGAALGSSELLTPVLRAPRTAYSYNPKEQAEVVDDLFGAGEQLALVSAFQARNSARFTLVGSAEMLQDKWFDAEASKVGGKKAAKTFNREFAKRVSGWTFNEIGVLRVNWIEHHLDEAVAVNESNPSIYRIKNDVVSTANPVTS